MLKRQGLKYRAGGLVWWERGVERKAHWPERWGEGKKDRVLLKHTEEMQSFQHRKVVRKWCWDIMLREHFEG